MKNYDTRVRRDYLKKNSLYLHVVLGLQCIHSETFEKKFKATTWLSIKKASSIDRWGEDKLYCDHQLTPKPPRAAQGTTLIIKA